MDAVEFSRKIVLFYLTLTTQMTHLVNLRSRFKKISSSPQKKEVKKSHRNIFFYCHKVISCFLIFIVDPSSLSHLQQFQRDLQRCFSQVKVFRHLVRLGPHESRLSNLFIYRLNALRDNCEHYFLPSLKTIFFDKNFFFSIVKNSAIFFFKGWIFFL